MYMHRGLEVDEGSSKLKYGVIAGIAVVFAVGVYAATSGGKSKPSSRKAAPAAERATVPKPSALTAPTAANTAAVAAPAAIASAAPVAEPTEPAAQPQPQPQPQPQTSAGESHAEAAAPVPPRQLAMASSMDDLVPGKGGALAPDDETVSAEAEAAVRERQRPAKLLRTPPPPAVVALSPWWRAKSEGAFNVQYVGQAAQQQTLVIRFSKSLAAPRDADQHIHVIAQDGTAAAGNWQLGGSPFVLVRNGLAPGRYLVRIDQGLNSAAGDKLSAALSGPIYIQ